MHELKCDLCSARLIAFSPWAVSVLLEEHMADRHPANKPPKHGEDLRLTNKDRTLLHNPLTTVHACRDARRSVICAVDFNGLEFGRVVRQEIARLHARWVEGTLPAVRGE